MNSRRSTSVVPENWSRSAMTSVTSLRSRISGRALQSIQELIRVNDEEPSIELRCLIDDDEDVIRDCLDRARHLGDGFGLEPADPKVLLQRLLDRLDVDFAIALEIVTNQEVWPIALPDVETPQRDRYIGPLPGQLEGDLLDRPDIELN